MDEFPSDDYDVTELTGDHVIMAVLLVIITSAVSLWWFNRTTRDCRTTDNMNSYIYTYGNSNSSQGGGQPGSGQNSTGNQNAANQQNSSGGGGQSSSGGGSGQGSSSGGDGNDEGDKEKMKQPKDGGRQNEVCATLWSTGHSSSVCCDAQRYVSDGKL